MTPKDVKPKELTMEIPPGAVEPDRIILQKVAGKIGVYKFLRVCEGLCSCPIDNCECWCSCGPVIPWPDDLRNLMNKIDLLTQTLEVRFGQLGEILSSLKGVK